MAPHSHLYATSAASVTSFIALRLLGPVMAMLVVGPSEGLANKPSAPHLYGFTPHSPPVAPTLFLQLYIFCPLYLISLLHVVVSRNGQFDKDDLLRGF